MLEARRKEMQAQQHAERAKLDAGQKERASAEAVARLARLRKGLRGLLDRVTGKRAALEKQNQMEAIWSLQRDREQRHVLVEAQLKDRQNLQAEIRAVRNRHAGVLRELHHDRTNFRLMMRGLETLAKKALVQRVGESRNVPGKDTSKQATVRTEKANTMTRSAKGGYPPKRVRLSM